MSRKLWIAGVLAALLAGMALAGSQARFVHVVVEDGKENGESVRIHLPLTVVENLLPLVGNEHLEHGRLKISGRMEHEGIDLAALWVAVREAEEGDFVTIDSGSEKVRVSKSGGEMRILVDETRGDRSKVQIRVPVAVVDALFSGPGEELDLGAALRVLAERGHGDLVRIDDGDSKVRIWIDGSAYPSESENPR